VRLRPFGEDNYADIDDTLIVVVAGTEDLLNNLTDALSDSDHALLHAQTKEEAIALLERLKSKITLAIVELELADFGGWDLIRQLTSLPNNL
jgi:DNA-binding response OmpR family regulator